MKDRISEEQLAEWGGMNERDVAYDDAVAKLITALREAYAEIERLNLDKLNAALERTEQQAIRHNRSSPSWYEPLC